MATIAYGITFDSTPFADPRVECPACFAKRLNSGYDDYRYLELNQVDVDEFDGMTCEGCGTDIPATKPLTLHCLCADGVFEWFRYGAITVCGIAGYGPETYSVTRWDSQADAEGVMAAVERKAKYDRDALTAKMIDALGAAL